MRQIISTKQRGNEAEQQVADQLVHEGYQILARNYAKRYGEIDIIAQYNEIICFIEVKARVNPLFDPAELISSYKQKRIIAVAKDFLAMHNEAQDKYIYRFDVALVITEHGITKIEYIENAFNESF